MHTELLEDFPMTPRRKGMSLLPNMTCSNNKLYCCNADSCQSISTAATIFPYCLAGHCQCGTRYPHREKQCYAKNVIPLTAQVCNPLEGLEVQPCCTSVPHLAAPLYIESLHHHHLHWLCRYTQCCYIMYKIFFYNRNMRLSHHGLPATDACAIIWTRGGPVRVLRKPKLILIFCIDVTFRRAYCTMGDFLKIQSFKNSI